MFDSLTEQTQLISQSANGSPGTANSSNPNLSDNGQYIVYSSDANNLVGNDTNQYSDIFLYNLSNDQNTRISNDFSAGESNNASSSPSISADGRYIAYYSHASNLVSNDNNEKGDIFIYDRRKQQTIIASLSSSGETGNNHSYAPVISADGNFVSYQSLADNLIANDNNFSMDIFRTAIISIEEE